MAEEKREARVYKNVTDKVGFGKYKDLTLAELNEKDASYLKWAMDSEAINAGCIKKLIGEIVEPKKLIYLDSVLWFGKYKGMVFGDICNDDRDYAEFLLGADGFLEYAEGNDPRGGN